MKKYSILSLLVLLICSCSSSSDVDPNPNPTPAPQLNKAPSIPLLVAPGDGLLCAENPLDFSWNTASDPDGDSVSYYIQVATDNSFSKDLQVKTTANTSTNFILKKGLAYYWRVQAKDSKNKTSNYSAVRKLYAEAEGEINHLPYAPSLISPVLNSNITTTSTVLEWNSSDVDDDVLKYDIYFGDVNPPPLVAENNANKTYEVTLSSDNSYFWKIIVKDGHGGESIGQIWSFKKN